MVFHPSICVLHPLQMERWQLSMVEVSFPKPINDRLKVALVWALHNFVYKRPMLVVHQFAKAMGRSGGCRENQIYKAIHKYVSTAKLEKVTNSQLLEQLKVRRQSKGHSCPFHHQMRCMF